MADLLDPCVISDFIKGEPGTLDHLQATPPVQIFISAITLRRGQIGSIQMIDSRSTSS
jgi:tRNA(fMet)-specific endonuclease VapC